jgi:propionyl-CoA carboxylase beta chain
MRMRVSTDNLRRGSETLAAKSERAAARQQRRGRGSARRRIELLVDPGSFVELDAFAGGDGDSVITGHAYVGGSSVFVFAQDFSVAGGTVGEIAGRRIAKVMDRARTAGAPVVGINDSAGGRLQEGVVAQDAYGRIFARNVAMSGAVPQISVLMGPCAGGAAYSPALTDFVVMVDRISHMFLTGPETVRRFVGEDIDLEGLGGARVNAERSGNAHFLAASEPDALDIVRRLLPYLRPGVPVAAAEPDRPPLPEAGDVRDVLAWLLDPGSLLEVHERYAPSVVAGFGMFEGAPVGVVANQSAVGGGRLTAAAAGKAARFVRTCDAYGVPVLSLVDTAGEPDWPEAACLPFAYAEADVPRVSVLLRPTAALNRLAMGHPRLAGGLCLAWPDAGADDDVDEVIAPEMTRDRVGRFLRSPWRVPGEPSPRKHDNLPL